MEIYNREFRTRLQHKLTVNTVIFVTADVLFALGIILPAVFFQRENRYLYESICILSSLALLYFSFIFYLLKYRALLDLKKRIKINDGRKKTVAKGYFKFSNARFTIDGVNSNIYEFDVGQKYLDNPVNRQLYIESSVPNPFETDKYYELTIVDNYILEYKEVMENEQ